MLTNPFTPSEIASQPDEFFGRSRELETLERSLMQGSVAIQGAIGIGKSSLLGRALLMMEGFQSNHRAQALVAIAHKDIRTVDEAARLLLEQLLTVDERQDIITFKVGSLFEKKSAEVCRNFVDGRHLEVLKRIVEREYANAFLRDIEMLIIAIDEVDKCPVPIARLIRSVVTHAQQQGVKKLRFLIAGVSPSFQAMVDEDPGIARFFFKTIGLEPMTPEEATDLIETKLGTVCDKADQEGVQLTIHPSVTPRIVALSGGHPHLVQLLGSHVVEHENDDPDGVIDERDLYNSLRTICYEVRGHVYESTRHMLELEGKLDCLNELLQSAPPGFPTRISRVGALDVATETEIQWLVDHNILSHLPDAHYGLVDEFLKMRLFFDQTESAREQQDLEREIIHNVSIEEFTEAELFEGTDSDPYRRDAFADPPKTPGPEDR